ncbi:MAG TPA: amidohydrolase family protein [Polyangiaceae bacterium]|nr:amidohydrolase family protein [Polyangiaceae bacterium]
MSYRTVAFFAALAAIATSCDSSTTHCTDHLARCAPRTDAAVPSAGGAPNGGVAGDANSGGVNGGSGNPASGGVTERDAGGGGARHDGGEPSDARVVSHDGSTVSVDGGDAAADSGASRDVICRALAPSKSGTCVVSGGTSKQTLITGTVLLPDRVLHGGQVLVDEAGGIACVGCDCASAGKDATNLICADGVISPGLINTHDHLQYSQNVPASPSSERYDSRQQWRRGLDGHTTIAPSAGATTDQLRWGELRFVMSGATSTVAQARTTGLLRNLNGPEQERLARPPIVDDTFPLDDANGARSQDDCSAYGANAITTSAIAADPAYVAHVAEGVDGYAANEFRCLSEQDPPHDALGDKSGFVHGAALGAKDYRDLAASHTALVWSPRSNLSLYGDTARVTEAARLGVLVALGTDWLPTGSMNMLRELACAASFNRERLGGFFSDRDLWLMVTANAASTVAATDAFGVLAPGRVADIAIFDGSTRTSYDAVVGASAPDVALVLRGGKPLYGDAAIVGALAQGCDALDVCGESKLVCLSSDIGENYATLAGNVGADAYPAFFCGTPANEPTCVPSRGVSVNGSSVYDGTTAANDRDGDGIDDAHDLCPGVFDPIRPMDSGEQPDTDGDGQGDACDPCPLSPGGSGCTPIDANDRDGDGVPDLADDCPAIADPTQTDADGDGKGDACDPCPGAANPGITACPSTIYAVKLGTAATGAVVSIPSSVVTARNAQGYFLAVLPSDGGYMGADNSGLFVFDPTNTVVAGTRVDVERATVAVFGGETELSGPLLSTVSTSNTNVAPVVVAPSDVATGGARAAALEGALVEVDGVTVTDANPAPGAGDQAPTNEFAVDAGLRVDDYFYTVSPAPGVGTRFGRIVGVLRSANGNSKIEPRSAEDITN